jgi:xanthine dehydrogenase YagS FAD-binding subunit
MTCRSHRTRSSALSGTERKAGEALLYELPIFEHVDATSVQQAASLLRTHGDKARIIAGGTDLLALMKDRVRGPQLSVPEILVNVKSIPEMSRMANEDAGGLRIGASVPLSDLESSVTIRGNYGLLSDAAGQVGTTQIRFLGTIGGNLCQRPRCLYFRHPDFVCYKKGGSTCHALPGEHRYYHSVLGYGRCAASHPSDLAPALIALRATAVLAGPERDRQVPVEELFTASLPSGETVLNPDEAIKELRIPPPGRDNQQRFLKRRMRHSADFSIASVAVFVRFRGRVSEEVRIVLGGIAPVPWRAAAAEEAIRGEVFDEKRISRAAELALKEARPLPMNGYKVDLAKALIRRALDSIAGDG